MPPSLLQCYLLLCSLFCIQRYIWKSKSLRAKYSKLTEEFLVAHQPRAMFLWGHHFLFPSFSMHSCFLLLGATPHQLASLTAFNVFLMESSFPPKLWLAFWQTIRHLSNHNGGIQLWRGEKARGNFYAFEQNHITIIHFYLASGFARKAERGLRKHFKN